MDRAQTTQFVDLHSLVKDSHRLPAEMPFTISYTDPRNGDLLPINNNDNMLRAFSTSLPLLRLFVYREQGMLIAMNVGPYLTSVVLDLMRREMELREKRGRRGPPRPSIAIGAPVDFRVVSAIVDADLLPDTVRRVKLLKHSSDRPLGFYIRDGTSVRVTAHGLEKVPGIFISRLVPGGLAEGTGLLAVNDEILEVNGIEVIGKSLDQVTDMMVANSQNLIITVKPALQPPSTPQTQPVPQAKATQKTATSKGADNKQSPAPAMNGPSDEPS